MNPRRPLNANNGDGISVVIPTYNSAAVLSDAIDSVLAQTHPPDELIVIDDGGDDDTESICRRYRGAIRYVRQDNAGASAARNHGAAIARCRWLAFLDADDLWAPDKLARQRAALAQNPEADFCVTAACVWSAAGRRYIRMAWTGSLDPVEMTRQLLVRNILTGSCSSMVVRADVFASVGGFAQGKAAEDRRLTIDLLRRYRGLILPDALVNQRPGPAHWSDPERHRREMIALIDDYADLLVKLDPSGRLRRRAVARMHERTGMHYLENGDLRTAARHLTRAALLDPRLANPWRVLINACLGRWRRPTAAAPQAVASATPEPTVAPTPVGEPGARL